MSNDIQRLQERVVQFGKARDWSKFHSPKNIAMALSVEAAEIMEHFQWLKEEQSEQLSDEQKKAVGYELADVFMYALLLSERLGVDLVQATEEKIAINEQRFKPTDS